MLKEFQFPVARTRTSHTSSPTNKHSLNATQTYVRAEGDATIKSPNHVPHLSLKVPSNVPTPTSRGTKVAQSYKAKYQDAVVQLDVLQTEYQKALEENEILRSQNRTSDLADGDSMSTMYPVSTDELDLRQSLVNEIEDLYEMLSNAHMSMAILMNSCDALADTYKSTKTELNTLKFQNQMTPPGDGQIKEVKNRQKSEELTRINEEMKAGNKEKQRLEVKLEELLKRKAEFEIENKGLKEKIRVLTRKPDDELSSPADILKKLNLARSLLTQSEDKAEKYEKYIQRKILKNKR